MRCSPPEQALRVVPYKQVQEACRETGGRVVMMGSLRSYSSWMNQLRFQPRVIESLELFKAREDPLYGFGGIVR